MKDIGIRALKTFIQGFLGALAITLPTSYLTDWAVIRSLLIGAVAAGLSAVMNLVINWLNNDEKQIEEVHEEKQIEENSEEKGDVK